MPTVIPVKFRYAARDLWFDPKNSGAQEADHVICSTERGTEIGIATGDAREVSERTLKDTIGNAHLSNVIRIATNSDLALADTLARKGDEALPVFRKYVAESGLDMKPVGVEYTFGGEKVVCYFAAEERVDFRQLVRDLSHALHQRIDMRQIGVREEAAIVGGYGHCGQELCCRRFGLAFEPVSIRMAKEQDLPLNSSKISGACGRLMCCLRYEFEAYRDFKSRAPKRNAVIDTPLGKAKIVEYDTPKEEICLRIENGKQVRIPLAEMVPSDAAKKKSQELGCACRPDTVLRSSLDKLNSPDVQMALAELDRKNGVTPPETFDDSDLFVDTKSRKRRSRKSGESKAEGQGSQQLAQQPTKRRQRRSQQDGAQQQTATQPAPHARRRHRRTDESVEEVREDLSAERRGERGGADGHDAADARGVGGEARTTGRGESRGNVEVSKPQPERQHGMRRRRHHRGTGVEQGSQQGQGGSQNRSGQRGAQGQGGQQARDAQQQGQGAQRKRRSKGTSDSSGSRGPGSRNAGAPSRNAGVYGSGAHASKGGPGPKATGGQGGARQAGSKGAPKHMRHPGDRGGRGADQGQDPGRPADRSGDSAEQSQRRRRRTSRGRGGADSARNGGDANE